MSSRTLTLSLLSLVLVLVPGCGDGAAPDSSATSPSAGAAEATPPPDPSAPLKKRVEAAVDLGIKYLRAHQEPKLGSVHFAQPLVAQTRHPGITAMVLLAYMRSHRKYGPEDGPFVRNALEWLVSLQKEDGAIYERDSANYVTSLALMALVESGDDRFRGAIEKARDYIVRIQAREETGYRPGDKFYGGIGYGGDERPDLSNAQFAVEAVRTAGLPKDHEFYKAALKFLERSQNWSETNDQVWKDSEGNEVRPGNDGGAIYYPGDSKAGIEVRPDGSRVFRSYGSMSYALLKSYLFCDLDRNDPRVKAVARWCAENFTVDHHPGFVQEEKPNARYQGLFYYYFSLSKALRAWGKRELKAEDGVARAWAVELAEKLLALQNVEDGSFVNERSGRWEEGSTVLCTAYALLALEECLPMLGEK